MIHGRSLRGKKSADGDERVIIVVKASDGEKTAPEVIIRIMRIKIFFGSN